MLPETRTANRTFWRRRSRHARVLGIHHLGPEPYRYGTHVGGRTPGVWLFVGCAGRGLSWMLLPLVATAGAIGRRMLVAIVLRFAAVATTVVVVGRGGRSGCRVEGTPLPHPSATLPQQRATEPRLHLSRCWRVAHPSGARRRGHQVGALPQVNGCPPASASRCGTPRGDQTSASFDGQLARLRVGWLGFGLSRRHGEYSLRSATKHRRSRQRTDGSATRNWTELVPPLPLFGDEWQHWANRLTRYRAPPETRVPSARRVARVP